MHVECSACGARYTIADEKIPAQGARVRCRKCQAVFSIARPAGAPRPVDLPVIPPSPQREWSAGPARPPAAPAEPPAQEAQPATQAEFTRGFTHVPSFAAPQQAPAPAEAATSARPYTSAGIPEGLPEAERAKHERARRLARVLASDIAIYNKEKRERGLKEGNLVALLGYEIKKSWEVYKERVTPELANSTPYFRDALNEMLADGKKIF